MLNKVRKIYRFISTMYSLYCENLGQYDIVIEPIYKGNWIMTYNQFYKTLEIFTKCARPKRTRCFKIGWREDPYKYPYVPFLVKELTDRGFIPGSIDPVCGDMIVSVDGNVTICPKDVDLEYVVGNVNNKGAIAMAKRIKVMKERIKKGLPICDECEFRRGVVE